MNTKICPPAATGRAQNKSNNFTVPHWQPSERGQRKSADQLVEYNKAQLLRILADLRGVARRQRAYENGGKQ